MTAILLALLAGVLTVAAPCVLPVLPALLAASIGRTRRTRPLFIALGFVASFAVAVLLFSAVAHVAGIDQGTLRTAAVILLIGFGLSMVWPQALERLAPYSGALSRWASAVATQSREGNVGGFVLGATLGLVWAPCAGPVLGSILTVIATTPDFTWGALLLVNYAIGAAAPMLAIAYGGQAVAARLRGLAPLSHRLQQGFGVLVILFAAATYFDYDTTIAVWLSRFYPNGNIGL